MTKLHQLILLAAAIVLPLMGHAQPASVAGNWLGTFDVVHSDGSVEPGSAYFSFQQKGEKIYGTAGKGATNKSPISSGSVSGNHLTFIVVASGEITVRFDLVLKGNQLRGSASGISADPGSNIVITAVRADDAWHISQPLTHVADKLFVNVAALDQKLFDAYNRCDLGTLSTMVSDDLEFYHDKTGLAVGRKVFVDSIQKNICGKTQRVLVPGTLEVHRLATFGALEMGIHRFTHPGHEDWGTGEAKFIQLWQLKDGEWKLTRVISYDHGAASK